jgi:hypothetical protein
VIRLNNNCGWLGTPSCKRGGRSAVSTTWFAAKVNARESIHYTGKVGPRADNARISLLTLVSEVDAAGSILAKGQTVNMCSIPCSTLSSFDRGQSIIIV